MALIPKTDIWMIALVMFVVFSVWVFALLLFILAESVFISTMGATPFKALLKIKILDRNGKKLSFANSFKRSYLVWFKGLAFGIPPITTITCILSNVKLKTRRATSWDRSTDSLVYCGRLSFLRSATAIVVGLGLLLSWETKDNTLNKVTEKNQTEKESDFLKKTASVKGKINSGVSKTVADFNSTVKGEGTNISNLEKVSTATALVISGSKDNLNTGSGFFITNSLLVTNSHVVENSLTKWKMKIVYIETQEKIRDIGMFWLKTGKMTWLL